MTSGQIVKRATAAIGLGLFAYLFVFFTQAAGEVAVWRSSASSNASMQILSGSVVVFRVIQHVDSSEYLGTVPAEGDTVISVVDSTVTPDRWNRYLDAPQKPGTLVPIQYVHHGDTFRTQIRLRPPTVSEFLLVSLLQTLRFLIALLFMSVALWAFFARPDSASVRALALFSFAMTAFMIGSVVVLNDRFAPFQIPYKPAIRVVLNMLAFGFGAFWLNLAMLFPRPVRLLEEHPVVAYTVCYAPTVLLLVALRIAWLSSVHLPLDTLVLITLTTQITVGITILAVRSRRTQERIERRQMRLVLLGTGIGLGILLVLMVMVQVFQEWLQAESMRTLVIVNFAFLGLLLSPITYAYALGRYRLLDVEARLRRGTRYVLAMGAMIGALALIAYAGSTFARKASVLGSFWSVAILCLISLGILSGARAARSYIVDRFYPERRRLRALFQDFFQSAYAVTDSRSFWDQIERNLRDGLMVEGVYPLMRVGDDGSFFCRASEGTPFLADCDLVARLERERKPIMVDEAMAAAKVRLSPEEFSWLSQRRIALLLPLMTHSGLVGFLGLGMKTEQEDYAAEELRLLDSLAPQMALASENIRLLEENVGKKRLEEQLEMARQVQHGFLPRRIPECPRLELAARCRFCFEVAGDYYDIIPLENGCTVLAVGDVSGKGAGAAMLMANLQASLRTAAGVGIPLTEIVSRINDLIYRNTPPEQFITFFVASFDPEQMELTYVNAGHNPPLLLRPGGNVETLDEGGLILGIFTGIAYRQATVKVSADDLLLMYTDGVSEAMNVQDDEFGEERIRGLIAEHRTAAPQEILEQIEQAVFAHRGKDDLEDDFTMLLARIQ